MRHGQPRSVRSQIDMPQPGELVFIACHDGKIRDAHVRRKVRKRAWNSWWNSESNRRLKARSSRPLKQCQTRFRIRNEHTTTCTAVSPRRESFVSLSPLQPVIESLGDEAGSIMDYCGLTSLLPLRYCVLTYSPSSSSISTKLDCRQC